MSGRKEDAVNGWIDLEMARQRREELLREAQERRRGRTAAWAVEAGGERTPSFARSCAPCGRAVMPGSQRRKGRGRPFAGARRTDTRIAEMEPGPAATGEVPSAWLLRAVRASDFAPPSAGD
ncbi:MAG TPA: hypothetical protein VFI90_11500 [Rubrobacter sp.]|nr:hypothetical protein [Rubrobacter sp.]